MVQRPLVTRMAITKGAHIRMKAAIAHTIGRTERRPRQTEAAKNGRTATPAGNNAALVSQQRPSEAPKTEQRPIPAGACVQRNSRPDTRYTRVATITSGEQVRMSGSVAQRNAEYATTRPTGRNSGSAGITGS